MLISKLLMANISKETDPELVTASKSITIKKGTYKAILISAGGNGAIGQQSAVSSTGAPAGGGGGSAEFDEAGGGMKTGGGIEPIGGGGILEKLLGGIVFKD